MGQPVRTPGSDAPGPPDAPDTDDPLSPRMIDPRVIDPMLTPAGRMLWRSPTSIQLELGARAVVVDGLGLGTARRLASRPGPAADRAESDAIQRALRTLADAGYVWPRITADPLDDESPVDDMRLAPPAPRLAVELAGLTARHGERAAELLSARRHSLVTVHGDGRCGSHIAALLAAAGIGRVCLVHPGTARLEHGIPGGIAPGDEGGHLTSAATAAIRRAAPEADTTAPPMGEPPDLVILAIDEPVDGERRDALHARDCPHLVVRLGPDHGSVGPLVLPGLTSCLRCADLHRLDRDPAWNALAVQLSEPRRRGTGSEVAVATAISAIAVIQALAFLDGEQPATIDGTLEMHLPDWRLRRRSWSVHHSCDCSG